LANEMRQFSGNFNYNLPEMRWGNAADLSSVYPPCASVIGPQKQFISRTITLKDTGAKEAKKQA